MQKRGVTHNATIRDTQQATESSNNQTKQMLRSTRIAQDTSKWAKIKWHKTWKSTPNRAPNSQQSGLNRELNHAEEEAKKKHI